MSEAGIAQVADKIVFGLNLRYGVFLALFSLYGLIFLRPIAAVGVMLGLVLIAWMFLKPLKKEGWLYAIIVNIVTIPTAAILVPFPLWAFPITFAVLIVFVMLAPPIREPFT